MVYIRSNNWLKQNNFWGWNNPAYGKKICNPTFGFVHFCPNSRLKEPDMSDMPNYSCMLSELDRFPFGIAKTSRISPIFLFLLFLPSTQYAQVQFRVKCFAPGLIEVHKRSQIQCCIHGSVYLWHLPSYKPVKMPFLITAFTKMSMSHKPGSSLSAVWQTLQNLCLDSPIRSRQCLSYLKLTCASWRDGTANHRITL